MLSTTGTSRSDTIDRRLAALLAGVAGALNASAFYAAGFFSANMTGNLSILSDHIALRNVSGAAFYLGVILTFISGAALASFFLNGGLRRGHRGIYAVAILLEGLLLLCLGVVTIFSTPISRINCFVFGIALLMGWQNAVSTRITDARVRTTHVSGIATDIGIAVALLVDGRRHPDSIADLPAVRARLTLHAITILSFLTGGIAGVILFRRIETGILWLAGLVLSTIAIAALKKITAEGPTAQA